MPICLGKHFRIKPLPFQVDCDVYTWNMFSTGRTIMSSQKNKVKLGSEIKIAIIGIIALMIVLTPVLISSYLHESDHRDLYATGQEYSFTGEKGGICPSW